MKSYEILSTTNLTPSFSKILQILRQENKVLQEQKFKFNSYA